MPTEPPSCDLCASIHQRDGKYAVRLHWADGEVICQSDYRFATKELAEAKAVDAHERALAALRKHGYASVPIDD